MIVKNFQFLARLELLSVFVFTFPTPFILPFTALSSDYPVLFFPFLWSGFLELSILLLAYLVAALIFAWAVNFLRLVSLRLDVRTVARPQSTDLVGILGRFYSDPQKLVACIRVNYSDLSLGAHMKGVLRPRIVISGGMLVGLLRGDKKSIAILDHEVAHIQHFDGWIPGFLGIYIIDVFGVFALDVFQAVREGYLFEAIAGLGPHSPSKSLILLSGSQYFRYKSWC